MFTVKVRLETVEQQDHILRLVLQNLVEPFSLGKSRSIGFQKNGVFDAIILGKMNLRRLGRILGHVTADTGREMSTCAGGGILQGL